MRALRTSAFRTLAASLEDLLDGPWRRTCVARACERPTLADALATLRPAMRTHLWPNGSRRIALGAAVVDLDTRTRRDGFHALNDWDGIAAHVNPEIIPVDVLDFVQRMAPQRPSSPVTVGVLLDYYFFHLLCLLSLRVWDDEQPGEDLQLTGRLLDLLQGPHGSGQPFVRHAETLLLIATSHYEPDEHGYTELLERVSTLPWPARATVAREHAGCLGAHLRFGYLATYGRDAAAMRDDNAADYPWLIWALDTVLDDIARAAAQGDDARWAAHVEALCGGLTADTPAMLEHPRIGPRLHALDGRVRDHLRTLEPRRDRWSPLSFFFNFSYNVIKGTVIDAALREDVWTVSYSEMLCSPPAGPGAATSRAALAETLMTYARQHPHRIRGAWLPVVAWDPDAGHAAWQSTMQHLGV